MKYVTFDLETANDLPTDEAGNTLKPWRCPTPLGISCAALAFSDKDEPKFYYGTPKLAKEEVCVMVTDMMNLVKDGYKIITWNGCSFDFSVMAIESGMLQECCELAYAHVDLMLVVTFSRGHFLGFDKALLGAGLRGKQHEGFLKDGSPAPRFSGIDMPRLWKEGETQLVLDYLGQDVIQLKDLVDALEISQRIRWISNAGKEQIVPMKEFKTVKECFDIPEPDTSWMSNPPKRGDFVEWMEVLK